MCGITGFLSNQSKNSEAELRAIVERMTDSLAHRGPDDRQTWVSAPENHNRPGVALGHRRLSIIDLSPLGRQPMTSASGRFTIVYNGEIYNHAELRSDLEKRGYPFRGHSDTEVLLAGIEHWGIRQTVKRCNGMFALAVWDTNENQLTLARDRIGIKPLFYGIADGHFLFGSELKAMRQHPAFRRDIDRNSLALFLSYNYVPAPHSIYEGVRKLPPGSLLTIKPDSLKGSLPQPEAYWDLKAIAEESARSPFTGTATDVVDQLDQLLRQAVKRRMIADVPLGAFLSGGVDSTTVVALMQQQSDDPVRTFTIGFDEQQFNEAEYAAKVAAHLGTNHTQQYVTPQQARDVIPKLPQLFDEPFADSSQIPTFLVSQLARQSVTVSLSGDGGDELYGGYNRYQTMQNMWQRIGGGWLPAGMRRLAAAGIRSFFGNSRGGKIGRKARTLADFLMMTDRRIMYSRLNTHWKHPEDIVIDGQLPISLFSETSGWASRGNFMEEMMYADSMTYLPDDILVKVDRASMGVSLEARVPLLDHELIEFAWSLPIDMKVRDGQPKWPLRQVLDRYVPRELIDRPKVGFGVPIESWLRGPLRDWAESLLDESTLREQGYLRPEPIRRLWDEHLSETNDWHYYLWDVLMFQAWLEAE